jgi:hypothetical protein
MLNLTLIRIRLGQYGLAWLIAFAVAFAASLAAAHVFDLPFARAADPVLGAGFGILGCLIAGFFVLTLAARQTWLTTTFLLILGLVLLLPLLWAPVLGVVVGAWVERASIEYSQVYAAFRILVGRLSYDVTEQIFGDPLVDAAWAFMQGFAAFVGFLAALGQAWHMLKQLSDQPGQAA